MIRSVTYYQAVCDRCGAVDDQGEYSAWAHQDSAIDQAEQCGWRFTAPVENAAAMLLCEDCDVTEEAAR